MWKQINSLERAIQRTEAFNPQVTKGNVFQRQVNEAAGSLGAFSWQSFALFHCGIWIPQALGTSLHSAMLCGCWLLAHLVQQLEQDSLPLAAAGKHFP